MKTADLTGPALAWAVAKCEGREDPIYRYAPEPGDKDYVAGEDYSKMFYVSGPRRQGPYSPSTDWSQGGPIIEREGMTIWQGEDGWYASTQPKAEYTNITWVDAISGPTHLIAAMRCYVASKLGDEIDIPKELQ